VCICFEYFVAYILKDIYTIVNIQLWTNLTLSVHYEIKKCEMLSPFVCGSNSSEGCFNVECKIFFSIKRNKNVPSCYQVLILLAISINWLMMYIKVYKSETL
jgi:hypothetical protein